MRHLLCPRLFKTPRRTRTAFSIRSCNKGFDVKAHIKEGEKEFHRLPDSWLDIQKPFLMNEGRPNSKDHTIQPRIESIIVICERPNLDSSRSLSLGWSAAFSGMSCCCDALFFLRRLALLWALSSLWINDVNFEKFLIRFIHLYSGMHEVERRINSWYRQRMMDDGIAFCDFRLVHLVYIHTWKPSFRQCILFAFWSFYKTETLFLFKP